jgi:glutamate N-acetyltransferase/amino-acid N-acetyltransferase
LVRAILVNAGNANACTGEEGDLAAQREADLVAEALGCPVEQVLVFSTGVIGQRFPIEKVEAALPDLLQALDTEISPRESILQAASAIMTTDTKPKIAFHSLGEEEHSPILLGIAKGSGMIHPDMATMLGFILSDAKPGLLLQGLLQAAVQESFHRITVDGDTSTNDAVLLWSTGKAEEQENVLFLEGLDEVCLSLARQIARDGEGATKLIEVRVEKALMPTHALMVAKTIAQSLLVKTAIHGEDPNWGRILAAAGRAGAPLDTRKLRVGIGEVCLYEEDHPLPENEVAAKKHLQGKEVLLWMELGTGEISVSCWTCDLSENYIKINADYRT